MSVENSVCITAGCHACCKDTEMMLTLADVERLERAGFTEFYRIDDEGYRVLRNRDGNCVFLDDDGRCSVYPIRPEGCRYYPWVYNESKGEMELDDDCPHSEAFKENMPDRTEILELVSKLKEERKFIPRIRTRH